MAYTGGFTAVTGATFTAAQYNTNVRDNFSSIWVYTTVGDIAYASSTDTLSRLGIGTKGQIISATSDNTLQYVSRYGSLQMSFGSGQNAIPNGTEGYVQCPDNIQLTRWAILGKESGSIVPVSVYHSNYAGFPSTATSDRVSDSDFELSAAQSAESTDLSGWSLTAFSKGDILNIQVGTITTVTQATIILDYETGA